MFSFICPVCRERLEKDGKTYSCKNKHCFDIAKSGYVNLLMSSQKNKQHGDDKEMVRARADFLNLGCYDMLSQKVCECVLKYSGDRPIIIDAGCGECKYTCDIMAYLADKRESFAVAGVDISKEALSLAKRRVEKPLLAVASVASIPCEDECADVLVNIFAPFVASEFARVIKKNGAIIRVYPLARHLWQLKELVYDVPYENPVPDMEEEGLAIEEKIEVRYEIELCGDEIMSLFKMTPYFYRTRKEDRDRLLSVESLKTELEFGIVIYKKK